MKIKLLILLLLVGCSNEELIYPDHKAEIYLVSRGRTIIKKDGMTRFVDKEKARQYAKEMANKEGVVYAIYTEKGYLKNDEVYEH